MDKKILQPSETANRNLVRKSLAAARDLPAGATVQPADLTTLRPGTGLAPGVAGQVVGRRLRVPVSVGTLIEWHIWTDDFRLVKTGVDVRSPPPPLSAQPIRPTRD